MVLLPNVFCVILFVRVDKLQKQLDTIMSAVLLEDEDFSDTSVEPTKSGDGSFHEPIENNDNSGHEPGGEQDTSEYESHKDSTLLTEPSAEEAHEISSTLEAAETIEITKEHEITTEYEITDKPADEVAEEEEQTTQKVYIEYSEDMIGKALSEGRKIVYLTFDDGPSHNTERILDILDEYNVKATFFTIGKENEEYVDDYIRIVEDGHTLGMHSYSHVYDSLYSSVDAFAADYRNISSFIERTTGIIPWLYRFPGGSSNLVSSLPMTDFISFLNEENITYFDWNVSAKDAEMEQLSVDRILDNILAGIDKMDICVVLMHDVDYLGTTVDMLPELLDRLVKMDAVILPITENTTIIQHIKADSVE